jgi:hypothetical protein
MKTYSDYPCPSHSPWDTIQNKICKAPGLWLVSTAGHGGLFMSPERARHFRTLFPNFEGYAGLPWLEEDIDQCLGTIAFADEFSDEAVFYAWDAVLNYKSGDEYYFTEGRAWLLSPAGDQIRARAEAYSASRAGQWRRGGCCTASHPQRGWITFWYRGNDRASTYTKDYVSQNWMTDAEITANPLPPKPAETILTRFNENDCGGVFTGHSVVSDADPGL